jgi:ribose-phosphate pyrophosphokinase
MGQFTAHLEIDYNLWNPLKENNLMSEHPLHLFSGSANPQLAQDIARILNLPLGKSTTRQLPDSEIHIMVDEVVRDQDIFIIQPCSKPVNDHLMELLLYMDAFRRASANSVSAVIPYFPYARQDRMAKGREAISARVVANMLENQGARRVIFVDIHNQAIQGFFTIPVDPISAVPVLGQYFRKPEFNNAAIVSPDVGRAGLAGRYAEYIGLPLVVMHKRRTSFQDTHVTHVVGDIKGRQPIIVDDVVSSGSVLKQIDALYEQGAAGKTYFAITHPVLLPSAIEILDRDDRIGKLVVSDTIHIPKERQHPKVEVISIAPLLADIIDRIHRGASISDRLVLS